MGTKVAKQLGGNGPGERLKEAGGSMSQQQLAKLVGTSQTAIGNVEAGYSKQPRNLLGIARVLGISPDWLSNGTGNMRCDSPLTVEWPFEFIQREEWLALTER